MSSIDSSIDKPPIFDGTNYAIWKYRMMIFLKSLDEGIWYSILDGWRDPSKVDPIYKNCTIPKPFIEWSQEEKSDRDMNAIALDTILSAVTINVYKLLTTCTSVKSAWEILRIKFESGDDRALMTLTNVKNDNTSKECQKLGSEDDGESCEDSDDENFKMEENKDDGETTIQEAFHNLYKDFLKVGVDNQKLKKHNETLLSEIANLKSSKISKTKDDVDNLRSKNLKLKGKNASIEFKLEIALNTIRTLEDKKVNLENEMEDLVNKISDLESLKKVVPYSKDNDVEIHMVNLEFQIYELNDLVNNLKCENGKLKDKDQQCERLKTEFEMALEEILNLEDKLRIYEKSNKELTAKIVELEKINSKFLSGSKKLDKMLGIGQSSSDRSGLGYFSEIAYNLNNPKKNSPKTTQKPQVQYHNQRFDYPRFSTQLNSHANKLNHPRPKI